MDDLYSNLLRATDNTSDITTEKYGTVTKLENNLCSVKEEESDLEHANVPILNGITVKTGDKVVLGFINNTLYNPVVYGVIGRKIDSGSDDEGDLTEYMKWSDYKRDLGDQTNNSEFLRALDNTIFSITGRGDL